MPSCLVHTGDESVTLSAATVKRLLDRGDGDAALLYLALLRRQGAEVNELSYGNTALDLSSGTLVCGEKQLRLSAREFDVMRYLLQMKGQNVSKEAILARVWGFDSNAVENHVEVYVGFLRKKLKAIGSNVHIEAARRLGYHLEVEGA